MKLFLSRFLLFLLPIALLLAGLEWCIREKPNSYKLKSTYLREKGHQIETLILGSSHTLYGVNPKWFDSRAFNAANVSQSPGVDYAFLETYKPDLKGLKHIVIRLSYDTLFETLKDSPEDWRLKDYKLYTDLNLEYRLEHCFEITATNLKESLTKFWEFYIQNEESLSCDSLGFGNDLYKRKQSNLERQGPVTAKKHTAQSWRLLESNISKFKAIVTWANQSKVKLYIVSTPCFSSYVNSLNEAQFNKMIEVGQSLDASSSWCTYINMMSHEQFEAEDFFDPDHLNQKGAMKFSKMLNTLINN